MNKSALLTSVADWPKVVWPLKSIRLKIACLAGRRLPRQGGVAMTDKKLLIVGISQYYNRCLIFIKDFMD